MSVTPTSLREHAQYASGLGHVAAGAILNTIAAEIESGNTWSTYEDIPYGALFTVIGSTADNDVVFTKLDDGALINFGPCARWHGVRADPRSLADASRFVRHWRGDA